jgi:hypothetical protein
MKIINLTTHDVTLSNGMVSITFPPSGNVARVNSRIERSTVKHEVGEGIQLALPTIYNADATITDLPKPKAGTYYIVSNYVAQLARRPDLLAPNSNTAERDSSGSIISIKEFQQYIENEPVGVEDGKNKVLATR